MSAGHPHSQESRQANQKISLAKKVGSVRSSSAKIAYIRCGGRGRQATMEEFRNTARADKDGVRKAKAQLYLDLQRTSRANRAASAATSTVKE